LRKVVGFFKCFAVAAISAVLISACSGNEPSKPKNIIYLIGDGMGMSHLSAYRHYKNSGSDWLGVDGKAVPNTLFDKYFVGMASTHPHDDTLVTDSAAGATALAAGIKTYNGAISVDEEQNSLFTVLQQAKKLNKLTATVSTSQITHATPASFWSHNESRHNQNEIADQAFDHRIDGKFSTDLLFGGGTKYLIREDRNLVEEFKQAGWQYTDNLNDIHKVDGLPALGLFAEKGLPYAIDNPGLPNRLAHMSKKALQLLNANNPNGFFVMIEGSQIDWCSHGNDVACAMQEMSDFEATLQVAIDFAKEDGNTLVVVTADHGTGGLTLGVGKEYVWRPDALHKVRISADQFIKQLSSGADIEQLWQQHIDWPLTSEQLEQFVSFQAEQNAKAADKLFVDIINQASHTGWTTRGHTGSDVAVIAFGPSSEQFSGHQDNTDLAKKLFGLLQ